MSEPALDDAVTRRVLWALPTGLYVLGSVAIPGAGRWNLMTINLVTQVATTPRVVAFSVEQNALSATLIKASGIATLSLLHRDDRAVVRKFVKPCEETLDEDGTLTHLAGQAIRFSPQGAPLLCSAVAWVELTVRSHLDFDSHVVFFGEVTNTGATQGFMEGSPSDRLTPILRMEDTKMNYGG